MCSLLSSGPDAACHTALWHGKCVKKDANKSKKNMQKRPGDYRHLCHATTTHLHTNTDHRHTDTQTHRHTDTQTHRHTDTQDTCLCESTCVLSVCVECVECVRVGVPVEIKRRNRQDTSRQLLLQQHTATHCNTLQYTATHCNTREEIGKLQVGSCCSNAPTTHCNTLQHTATHCNTLQHTATHCNTLQHTATHCYTLPHTATHCYTLLHAATHSTKLQHTTAHCKVLQLCDRAFAKLRRDRVCNLLLYLVCVFWWYMRHDALASLARHI